MTTLAEEAVARFKEEYAKLLPSEKVPVEGAPTPAHNLGVSIALKMEALADANRDFMYYRENPSVHFGHSYFLFPDWSRAIADNEGLRIDV